jgi:hypothetical protein
MKKILLLLLPLLFPLSVHADSRARTTHQRFQLPISVTGLGPLAFVPDKPRKDGLRIYEYSGGVLGMGGGWVTYFVATGYPSVIAAWHASTHIEYVEGQPQFQGTITVTPGKSYSWLVEETDADGVTHERYGIPLGRDVVLISTDPYYSLANLWGSVEMDHVATALVKLVRASQR